MRKKISSNLLLGAVALLAVFGTVIADSLTAALGVPIIYLVGITTVLMGLCFFLWYRATKNLSIHQIRNSKRETYYWITVAVSFALGTLMGTGWETIQLLI
ncbi:hypothetical protein [Lactococcus protaetiae]|uniref:hypothetical protein n=1 Tax=Lactococcus protaetiae TaxID=2592653 RepID=UPI001CC1DCCB|nr:hypothetical protein [Lactococcus protaetiae]